MLAEVMSNNKVHLIAQQLLRFNKQTYDHVKHSSI